MEHWQAYAFHGLCRIALIRWSGVCCGDEMLAVEGVLNAVDILALQSLALLVGWLHVSWVGPAILEGLGSRTAVYEGVPIGEVRFVGRVMVIGGEGCLLMRVVSLGEVEGIGPVEGVAGGCANCIHFSKRKRNYRTCLTS